MRHLPVGAIAAVLVTTLVGSACPTLAWGPATRTRTPTQSTPTRTVAPPSTPTPTSSGTPTRTRTQTPTSTVPIPPLSDAFQLRYAANLAIGDSVLNLTNAGTLDGESPAGDLCANVYVFAADDSMLACCACALAPNGLASYSVVSDLINNPITPSSPTSAVVKLLATAKRGGACNAANPTAGTLAAGLRAWGTTIHSLPTTPVTYGLTETEFSSAELSQSELSRLTETCADIQTNGGGAGICRNCRAGGL